MEVKKVANIKSAKKRIKVTKTKHEENIPVKSTFKSAVTKALNEKTKENIDNANKKIDKALKKGIITKNKAARAKSRISKNK